MKLSLTVGILKWRLFERLLRRKDSVRTPSLLFFKSVLTYFLRSGLHNDIQNESSIVGNLVLPLVIQTRGTEEQKRDLLPKLLNGEALLAFGLTVIRFNLHILVLLLARRTLLTSPWRRNQTMDPTPPICRRTLDETATIG